MQDWRHIISIYHDDDQRVGTRLVESFNADPKVVSGILVNVFDALIDKIPEQHQNKFEKTALDMFTYAVAQRHNYTGKENFY